MDDEKKEMSRDELRDKAIERAFHAAKLSKRISYGEWVKKNEGNGVFNISDGANSPNRWLASVQGYGTAGFVGAKEAEANANAIIALPKLRDLLLEVVSKRAEISDPYIVNIAIEALFKATGMTLEDTIEAIKAEEANVNG